MKTDLDKDKKLLVATLRKLKSSEDLSAFLDDILTEEEILDLAQRIKIAKLILDEKTYDEIAEKIQTSTSTACHVDTLPDEYRGKCSTVVSKIGQIIEASAELKSFRLVRRSICEGRSLARRRTCPS